MDITEYIRQEQEDLLADIREDFHKGAFEMPKLITLKVRVTPTIPLDDEAVHVLPEYPFCQDMTCPCHEDQELIQEYIAEHLQEGLLTEKEAEQLYRGQQKEVLS